MIRGLLAWIAAGAAAGLALGIADGAWLLAGSRRMFVDPGEAWRTAAAVAGMCAGAGAAGSLLMGICAEAIRASRWTGSRPRLLAALAAVPAAAVAAWLAWELTAGPRASEMSLRPAIVAGAGLAGALGGGAAVALARWAAASGSRCTMAASACILGAALCRAVDSLVLVRLYPLFHEALAAGSFVLAAAGLRVALERARGRWLPVAAVAALLASSVAAGWSLREVRSSQNPRFVVSERSVGARHVLGIARCLAPPPPDLLLDEIVPTPGDEALVSTEDLLSVPGRSVFLVSVDAMRADRLLPPEGRRRPAPNLDALAGRSVVFERAYTATPHTSYALTSLLTGKYVRPLFDVPGAPAVHETWPEILRRFRYRSCGFFTKAVFFIDRPRFEPYLAKGYGFDRVDMDYDVPALERVERLVAHLEGLEDDGRPVFAWIHFFEPHEPYDPACTRYGDSDEARYDCEISVADEAVGALLSYLERERPDAIVIATADHGEEFGDHGGRFHGTTLYDEQVRVPLIVHIPGVPPRSVTDPVSLVDLLGTVLSALDIPIPARVRSRDLSGLLTGRGPGPGAAFTEVGDRAMAVGEGHKLVRDRLTGIARLYDLVRDPGEHRSVLGERPEVAARLGSLLRQWERDHARVEIRPVRTEAGAAGWPGPVRRVLEGEDWAVSELPAAISSDAVPGVRRKAAELVAAEWGDRPVEPLLAVDPRGDAEIEAWLAVARIGAGDEGAIGDLGSSLGSLDRHSPAWRAAVLLLAERGERARVGDALAIALEREAPAPDRCRAIRALAEVGGADACGPLASLIDEYQVSQDVVLALGRLGCRREIPILVRRLKRERFPERRGAVAKALGAIGDRRVVAPVAGELARPSPATGALGALEALGAGTKRGRRIRADEGEVVVWSRPGTGDLGSGLDRVDRIAVAATAPADGGGVVVSCDGSRVGRAPVFAGRSERVLDVSGCVADGGVAPRIALVAEPADAGIEIVSAAAVSIHSNDELEDIN